MVNKYYLYIINFQNDITIKDKMVSISNFLFVESGSQKLLNLLDLMLEVFIFYVYKGNKLKLFKTVFGIKNLD